MKKSALILLMKRVEKKETSTKLCWLLLLTSSMTASWCLLHDLRSLFGL